MGKPDTITLSASDVSGQKLARADEVPPDCSVGELIEGLLSKMQLPKNDVEGRPLTYQALLEREGRHLQSSETVGDALEDEDRIVLQPNINAGCAG